MASANYGQLGSNNYIQRRVDMYVLGSCIEVQHCHCPSSPNVPQNRYCGAGLERLYRRGADRSSQVGCGKTASWGGGQLPHQLYRKLRPWGRVIITVIHTYLHTFT